MLSLQVGACIDLVAIIFQPNTEEGKQYTMKLKFSSSTEGGGGGNTSPGTADAEDDITERGTNTTTTSKRPTTTSKRPSVVGSSMLDPLKRRYRDEKVVGLGGKQCLYLC